MSKKSIYKSEIELNLKKSSLNLENLYKNVTNLNTFKSSGKQFYGALMDLLNNNKIGILGYDFNVHNVKDERIQSFKKEGVVFEWVKTDQIEIFTLLNQMNESSDLEKSKKAKKAVS